VLIERCAIYEKLYLVQPVPKHADDATGNLLRVLFTLYTAILEALCRLIRVFESRTSGSFLASSYSSKANSILIGKWVDKLKSSESTLAQIKGMDEPESVVSSAVTALENCYQSTGRQHAKGRSFNFFSTLLILC